MIGIGLSDQVGWRNIHHLRGQSRDRSLRPQWTLTPSYNAFWLADAHDGLYNLVKATWWSRVWRMVRRAAGWDRNWIVAAAVLAYAASRRSARDSRTIFPGTFLHVPRRDTGIATRICRSARNSDWPLPAGRGSVAPNHERQRVASSAGQTSRTLRSCRRQPSRPGRGRCWASDRRNRFRPLCSGPDCSPRLPVVTMRAGSISQPADVAHRELALDPVRRATRRRDRPPARCRPPS